MSQNKKIHSANTSKTSVPNTSIPVGRELSTVGLKVTSGVVHEEACKDLAWPANKQTYKKMMLDPTISSANNTIKAFVKKLNYTVVVNDKNPTPEKQAQINFINECMSDMDTHFSEVINEALSFIAYGYSIHEKVFKYRNNSGKFKSKFNDGRIGWAKLPIRSQDTIWRWHFDAEGRELKAVEQQLQVMGHNHYNIGNPSHLGSTVIIPRKRFLHFRHDVQRNNPEGTSALKACYSAWAYKNKIEEYEAMGVSRDLGGLPVVEMPPEYMSDDAPADKQAFYRYMQQVIQNIHANEQAGLILPKYVDPETRQDLFTFKLISVDGSKQYDTDKIISRYENKILMTFLADVLKLGQDASGSFALSDSKTNLLSVGISALITEILDQFNHDLIPQTLKMNGWDLDSDTPRIVHDDLDDRDIESLGKFVQQVTATGAMEVDEGFSDWLRETIGAPTVDRSNPINVAMVAGGDSRSGDGMASGMSNGTGGSTGSSGDASASNANN